MCDVSKLLAWNKLPRCEIKQFTEGEGNQSIQEKKLMARYKILLSDLEKGMYADDSFNFNSDGINKYFKNIHKVLFTSVETYYTISSILHVVFLLQSNSDQIKLSGINVVELKQMLFVSAIEQLGFIMYEFYKYGKMVNKCMEKSAKYIARLSCVRIE